MASEARHFGWGAMHAQLSWPGLTGPPSTRASAHQWDSPVAVGIWVAGSRFGRIKSGLAARP